MKKIIFVSLLSLISVFSFSQDSLFTLSQMKQVWEPRWMPSVANLDKTWESLWNKRSDGIPASNEINTSTTYTLSAVTSFSTIPGLTQTLESGTTYEIKAIVSFTTIADSAGFTPGCKLGVNYSGTLSNARIIIERPVGLNASGVGSAESGAGFTVMNISTSYATVTGTGSGVEESLFVISGFFTTSSTGILTIQGASEKSYGGSAISFPSGSYMIVSKLN